MLTLTSGQQLAARTIELGHKYFGFQRHKACGLFVWYVKIGYVALLVLGERCAVRRCQPILTLLKGVHQVPAIVRIAH